MTDKDKQVKLPLGDVEYITDPNFVPERLVDQVGIDNLTTDHFYTLIEPLLQSGQVDLDYGECEGDEMVIFGTWGDLYEVVGVLNGFEGLGDKPYLSDGETFQDKIKSLQNEIKETDPNHLGTLSRLNKQIQDCESWINFNHFIEVNEYEKVGFDDFGIWTGFSDEYSRCACGNCSNIVRTSPNSYDWIPPLFIECEGYIADECASYGDFDDEILEQYANVQRSLPEVRSPEDLGLVQVSGKMENGLYGGQNDTPEPIIEALNAAGIDVWFVVEPRQFDMDFWAFVREADQLEAASIINNTNTELDYDPAVQLEKALKSISLNRADDSEGVTVNKVDISTGTVKTKVVSKQDFIDGKALDD